MLYELRTQKERIASNDTRYAYVKSILPELSLLEWSELDEETKEILIADYLQYQAIVYEQEQWQWQTLLSDLNSEIENYRRLLATPGAWSRSTPPTHILNGETVTQEIVRARMATAEKTRSDLLDYLSKIDQRLSDIRDHSKEILSQFIRKPSRLEKLFSDLEKRLSEPYSFDVFARDSVNFGILINYRQEWKPLNFQVGDLVSTMPLAPQEVRRYTKKRVVKEKRAEKEIQDSLRVRKTESSETSRVEAEIVQKASNKTNFHNTVNGGFNIGVANVDAKTDITVDAAKESADTKKDIRESVLKAAEEYKQEHKLEISTERVEETEETTYGEVRNPNDEIPVTYLYYELQRTYQVSEKIHSVRPVILVANQVPRPDEIDEDWLITHQWILRRVILDDSFLPALDYLSKGFAGDELAMEALRVNMEKQTETVERMARQVEISTNTMEAFRKALDNAVQGYARARAQSQDEGGLFDFITGIVTLGASNLFDGGDNNSSAADSARIIMDAAKDSLSRAERQLAEAKSQAQVELTALQVATDKYTQALRDHFDWRTAIDKLRIHVKQNILYYMQAIWNHEPPDQRFFRLYKIDVPIVKFRPLDAVFDFSVTETARGRRIVAFGRGGFPVLSDYVEYYVKLHEIADLDNLLGYKGNYMIFPLKKLNHIVNYMLQEFIDVEMDEIKLRDPDEFGNYTLDEILDYARCLYEKNPGEFNKKYKPKIREIIVKRSLSGRREKDIVIVPTDSLYMEALPGKHPLLEDFKLIHRALDVKKVQGEVRHTELENIRLVCAGSQRST